MKDLELTRIALLFLTGIAVIGMLTAVSLPTNAALEKLTLEAFINGSPEKQNGSEEEPVRVAIGDQIEYRISMWDRVFSDDNKTISFINVVPSALTIVDESISHGGVYDPTTRTIVWELEAYEVILAAEVSYTVVVTGHNGDDGAARRIENIAHALWEDASIDKSNTTYHELSADLGEFAWMSQESTQVAGGDVTLSLEATTAPSSEQTRTVQPPGLADVPPRNTGIAPTAAYLIDLSTLAVGNTGTGWTYTDVWPLTNNLIFNNGANSHVYTIYQSSSTIVPRRITVNADVDTTLILSGINCALSINLTSGAKVKLLLAGTNTMVESNAGINSQIIVGTASRLTIDSASSQGTGSIDGTLNLTASVNVSSAAIGGNYDTDSGEVIINGGTLNVVQKSTTYAAIGGSNAATSRVTINGGAVTASAAGGAAIGGGSGYHAQKPFSGYVTINGGTVDARISAGNSAAIGGGYGAHGKVTITGGNVTAIVLTLQSHGAAIGGGMHGNGEVTITGGTIKAHTAGYGSAIGGGGAIGNNTTVPGYAYVIISGGDMDLKSHGGSCVGHGGKDHAVGESSKIGYVTITGGKIFGDFDLGSIVGSGRNFVRYPIITIDVPADIVGFGRAISNTPGIDCGAGPSQANKNEGNAYFVNGNFVHDTVSANQMMVVYNKSNLNVPLRFVRVPFAFKGFTYTTGTTGTRADYVFIGDPAGSGLKQVIRKSAGTLYASDLGVLYAIKRPYDYYESGHGYQNYWMSLYATWGESGFTFRYPIIEKHVDIYGEPIDVNENGDFTDDDTLAMVESGKTYTGIPLNLDRYTFVGHNWARPNASGSDYSSGAPTKQNITSEYTVYFVYREKPTTTDVSFTKVDAFDTMKVLEGAQFKLFELVCTSGGHNHVSDPADLVDITNPGACWSVLTAGMPPLEALYTSGSDGVVTVGPLSDGYYQLVEIASPRMYQLPVGQWLMRVIAENPNTAQGGYQLNFIAKSKGIMPNAVIRQDKGQGVFAYLIVNATPLALPLAGLEEQNILVLIGMALLVLASASYVYLHRKKDLERREKMCEIYVG